MDQIKIGKFIQENRKNKGMTQSELASQLGISDRTISKWENGHGIPDLSLLEPLSELFEISVSELLSGERYNNTLKESNKKVIEILSDKEKERKTKIIFLIVGIIITIILAFLLILEKNKSNNDYIIYKNGIYTNHNNVSLTYDEVRILMFMEKTEEDIKNINNKEKDIAINAYYSELDTYRMYGFIGYFDDSKIIDGQKILHMYKKEYTPFVRAKEENTDEYYCYFGTTSHGAFLLGRYTNNTCIVNDIVCTYASNNESINKYCK